jgi:hypothetical protein
LDEVIVELAGGAFTTTRSPHLENRLVSLPPFEAVPISSIGRVGPLAGTVSVYDAFGPELVAAIVHLSTSSLAPLWISVDSFVPFAAGSTPVTDEIVRLDLRLEYSLEPALTEIQSLPSFFACAEFSPKIVVKPEEFPLT